MVLVLVLAHVVLTLPAFTINLISTFKIPSINLGGVANDVVILMFFANAAVNPILYGAFNTNFQAAAVFCPCHRGSGNLPGITPSPHSIRNSSMMSPSLKTAVRANTITLSPSPNQRRKEFTIETCFNTSHANCARNGGICNDEIHSNKLNVPSV
jgi:hypothetical protein